MEELLRKILDQINEDFGRPEGMHGGWVDIAHEIEEILKA